MSSINDDCIRPDFDCSKCKANDWSRPFLQTEAYSIYELLTSPQGTRKEDLTLYLPEQLCFTCNWCGHKTHLFPADGNASEYLSRFDKTE